MDHPLLRFLADITLPNTYVEISTLTHVLTTDPSDVLAILSTHKNDDLYVLGCVPTKKEGKTQRSTKNEDIKQKNYVFFDLDIRKVYPEYTNDDIIALGMELGEKLKAHKLFSTWRYIIFSGNGLHIYYICEGESIESETYSRGYEKVSRELSQLLPVPVDTQCKNVARISRLPYSYNNKNGKHSLVYPVATQESTNSPLLRYILGKGQRDRVSVEEVVAYTKTTPITELCRLFGIQITSKGEIIIQGETSSAKINEKGNYVNRFSGKAGSGDFIAIYREVFGTEFLETVQIVADKVFKKDLNLNEKEQKLESRETIKKTRKAKVAEGYDPLVWNTDTLTASFPVIKPYSYIVIAGETKSGKSTFAFDLAIKNARRGKRVIYYTLEMTREQLVDNIARTAAKITPLEERYALQHGIYPEGKEEPFRTKKNSILALETLMVLGKEYADETTIISILDNVLEYPDTDLVIIDNLDKIDAVGRQDDITRQKYISSTITYFTNEYNIPTQLVHHLRKEGGERSSKLFRGIDSLSGSSKISHDADMTIFVARERDMDGEFLDSDTWIRVMETREFSPVTKLVRLIDGSFEDPFSIEK